MATLRRGRPLSRTARSRPPRVDTPGRARDRRRRIECERVARRSRGRRSRPSGRHRREARQVRPALARRRRRAPCASVSGRIHAELARRRVRAQHVVGASELAEPFDSDERLGPAEHPAPPSTVDAQLCEHDGERSLVRHRRRTAPPSRALELRAVEEPGLGVARRKLASRRSRLLPDGHVPHRQTCAASRPRRDTPRRRRRRAPARRRGGRASAPARARPRSASSACHSSSSWRCSGGQNGKGCAWPRGAPSARTRGGRRGRRSPRRHDRPARRRSRRGSRTSSSRAAARSSLLGRARSVGRRRVRGRTRTRTRPATPSAAAAASDSDSPWGPRVGGHGCERQPGHRRDEEQQLLLRSAQHVDLTSCSP